MSRRRTARQAGFFRTKPLPATSAVSAVLFPTAHPCAQGHATCKNVKDDRRSAIALRNRRHTMAGRDQRNQMRSRAGLTRPIRTLRRRVQRLRSRVQQGQDWGREGQGYSRSGRYGQTGKTTRAASNSKGRAARSLARAVTEARNTGRVATALRMEVPVRSAGTAASQGWQGQGSGSQYGQSGFGGPPRWPWLRFTG